MRRGQSVVDGRDRSRAPGDSARAVVQARLVTERYRLLRELGRGGMGVVWLAEDEVLGRQVAVKELRPPIGLAGADLEGYQRRSLREARSAARVHHPNAVTLHQVIPATAGDDAVYLIMELIEGPTLAEVIRRNGAIPEGMVVAYGLQLLSVLEAAHAMKLVHRDVKPGNIMIAPGDQVKLTDFGIAYTIGDTHLTRGGIVGTQEYLAPELFKSGAEVTAAADLWSLGATLLHAAEGRSPFGRESTAATLGAILNEKLPVPRCSPALAAAITGMLQRDPARRTTIDQARAQLRRAVGQQPSRESPPDPVPNREPKWNPDAETRRHAKTVAPGDQVPEATPGESLPRNRRHLSRRTVIAGTLLAVAAGIVADVAAHSGGNGILALRATITDPGGGSDVIAFSSDSTMLATYGSSNSVTLWDVTDGNKIASLPYGTGISGVAFSPGSKTLAVADSNGNLHLWDIATRSPTISMDNEAVLGFAFSPDGKTMATSDSGPSVYLWNTTGLE